MSEEGTLYIRIRFPVEWPPKKEETLLDHRIDDVRVRLTIRTNGGPLLTFDTAGISQSHEFQPIRPVGVGYAAIAFTWGDEPPSLYINEVQIVRAERAGSTPIDIPLEIQAVPSASEIVGFSDAMLNRMTAEERLFLRTLGEIEQKLQSGSEYDLLSISGLLRKLLLESNPVVHQVNRHYGCSLRYRVLKRQSLKGIADDPETSWRCTPMAVMERKSQKSSFGDM